MHTVRIWDLPTRLFHWLLLLCVLGLVLTGSVGGHWMNWHLRLGYTVLVLILFRFAWGFVGGHWSRFGQFVPTPMRVWRYARSMTTAPSMSPGHNPLGALSVMALLFVLLLQGISGLFSDDEIAFFGPLTARVSGEVVSLATWYHKAVGKPLLLGLIGLHVLAIAIHHWVRHEPLVWAMVTGDKQLPERVPDARDTAPRRWLALLLACLCAMVVYGVVVWGPGPGY